MAVQRGRSKSEETKRTLGYVELLSDARTKLADFFNILLVQWLEQEQGASR